MEPSTTNNSVFIALLGASVGAILGAIITYFCSLKLSERNHRKIAGAKLRAAFAPEIAEYKTRVKKSDFDLTHDDFLKKALVKHSAAIEEYRWYVPLGSQRAYQQAWENYYFQYGGIYFTDYLVGPNREKIFHQRIEAILRFTEL